MTIILLYSILDKSVGKEPTVYINAAVAQSVERRIGSAEVTGSIPVGSFKKVENKGISRKLLFEMSLFLFCYSNH